MSRRDVNGYGEAWPRKVQEMIGAVARTAEVAELYPLIKQGNYIAAGHLSAYGRSVGLSYVDLFETIVKPKTGLDLPEWDRLMYENDLHEAKR